MESIALVAVLLGGLSHVLAEDISKPGHGLIGYGISMYEVRSPIVRPRCGLPHTDCDSLCARTHAEQPWHTTP